MRSVAEEELPEALGAVHIDPSYDEVDVQTTVTSFSDDIDWTITDYDIGSDFVDDDVLVSEEDMNEYEKILMESGFNTLMQKLEENNNQWKGVEINIAITGESGCGKSTLINALRDMKADDIGAAKIGCTETTKEPTPYPYKETENVKIWDLPGVGTPNFPKETYLKTIKIEQYDFILLVSSTRYKENDTWLAKEINISYPNSNLFFIRTKVDSDLENYLKGHRMAPRMGQRTILLKTIRDESMANLTAAGIKLVKMFLINSHRPETFEFGKLQTMLIEKVSALKRDAMILSLSSVSNNVVAEKIRVLERRIGAVSVTGAIAAIKSERQKGQRLELDVLMTEVLLYKRQLGIDAHAISVFAKMLKKQEEELYMKLNMHSHAILKTSFAFAKFYDQYDKFRPSAFHSFPLFGRISKVRNYQRQCSMVLKCLLKMCSSECHRLQTNLAIWLNE
ncbi:hypothetical protein DPMN_013044 [Dreissena polymorpha]|uniref:IRG-type G domain-containing protein n=1 Tax=Dreissena polymorpha TaxID=45954 RepID=A0A9D4N6X8_DREPO|nr:hypothetical protein DPMN_013044 [Dreissena polymorpha]